jgi:hypothetical protein
VYIGIIAIKRRLINEKGDELDDEIEMATIVLIGHYRKRMLTNMVQLLDIRFMITVGKNMIWNCIGATFVTVQHTQQVLMGVGWRRGELVLPPHGGDSLRKEMTCRGLFTVVEIGARVDVAWDAVTVYLSPESTSPKSV